MRLGLPMRGDISLWRGLRFRLQVATQKRGAQADIARDLGVARQAVSNWLSGAVSPTAETTLRLLKWVEEAEAKQQTKRAGSAVTRPALTTQKSKSKRYEKAKSSQTK